MDVVKDALPDFKIKMEGEIRKPRRGRKRKIERPDYNLKVEIKDVEIQFN